MRRLLILMAALGALAVPSGALGAPSDPLFVLTPTPPPPPKPVVPPPVGYLSAPCGIAVAPAEIFFVSDYYHHAVDAYKPPSSGTTPEYAGQLFANTAPESEIDHTGPVDDPCALALDGTSALYLNNYHRNVIRFPTPTSLGTGETIAGEGVDASHPTGVATDPVTGNVYVDERTAIAAFDSSGEPIEDEGQPLRIGAGDLGEGYGLAFSRHSGNPLIYVADASTETVKAYNADPSLDTESPVRSIDGHGAPGAGFTSLRDAALAADDASGDLYVSDDLQPAFTEQPQASIEVFDESGAYQGHLKNLVINARPVGIAVDNTGGATQGRVYVSSGNTDPSSIYAYGPGAATNEASVCVPFAVCPLGSSGASADFPAAHSPRGAAVASSSPPPSAQTAKGKSGAEVIQRGNMRLAVNGDLRPRTLPRTGTAPVSVSVGWKIDSTDEAPPPKLKRLSVQINRHGHFDFTGLPTCPYGSIQPSSSSHALAACKSALIGTGRFEAMIALNGQLPYPTGGRLLVFNGEQGGKPVLFGQIYAPRPFATSFVIVFAIRNLDRGAFGTELSATLPSSLTAWGNLTAIQMTLERRYSYRGTRHSYISAGCPAPKGFGRATFPLARSSYGFGGGLKVSSTLVRSCRAR